MLTSEQAGLAVAVALGAGMLIGLDRERHKGEGPDREAAGLRTFMVAALAGAVAQIVSPVLAAVALVGVMVLAALSYWRGMARDPGLTTELALVATALIGVLAVERPGLAAGCAVVLASVLAAKARLHHFATDWLTQQELHDGLLLAALALVLLPLLPAEPVAWLGQLSPRRILMLVVLILTLQAAGHLAQRLLGAKAGLAVSGLLGGFVSSTATIGAMGALVRSGQAPVRLGLCAAVLSMAATWVQLLLMASVVAPHGLATVLPLAVVGAMMPLLLGALLWRQGGAGSLPEPDAGRPARGGVLRLREAALIAALLLGGAVLVNWAQQHGTPGLLMGTAVAALADAHAPMASLYALFEAQRLPALPLLSGLLVAIGANGLTRAATALVAGGRRFGLAVAGALLLNLLVACAWVWLSSR